MRYLRFLTQQNERRQTYHAALWRKYSLSLRPLHITIPSDPRNASRVSELSPVPSTTLHRNIPSNEQTMKKEAIKGRVEKMPAKGGIIKINIFAEMSVRTLKAIRKHMWSSIKTGKRSYYSNLPLLEFHQYSPALKPVHLCTTNIY